MGSMKVQSISLVNVPLHPSWTIKLVEKEGQDEHKT